MAVIVYGGYIMEFVGFRPMNKINSRKALIPCKMWNYI
jgi:hypothetical protein